MALSKPPLASTPMVDGGGGGMSFPPAIGRGLKGASGTGDAIAGITLGTEP